MVNSRIRFSWLKRRLDFRAGWTRGCGRGAPVAAAGARAWLAASDSIFLQPPVERAPAQTQRVGRLADVSPATVESFGDQQGLHHFQSEILHLSCSFARVPQDQVARSR